ncbi:hypothetical protein BJY00DRAFT_174012 [Aspergillus carlsbadensis]|nr:hypothetical protein BJY00DRAFT_174012 [Aspergillus carlsbadensis]
MQTFAQARYTPESTLSVASAHAGWRKSPHSRRTKKFLYQLPNFQPNHGSSIVSCRSAKLFLQFKLQTPESDRLDLSDSSFPVLSPFPIGPIPSSTFGPSVYRQHVLGCSFEGGGGFSADKVVIEWTHGFLAMTRLVPVTVKEINRKHGQRCARRAQSRLIILSPARRPSASDHTHHALDVELECAIAPSTSPDCP